MRHASSLAQERLAHIETLRGLACVLLVSWHTVGDGTGENGLGVLAGHPLHWVNALFLPVRMPLFAFLSGFVFSAAASRWRDAGRTIGAKARRLLIPLVVVGTLHFLLQSLIQENDLRRIWIVYLGSYEHFWYLQATFVLMAVLAALNVVLRGEQLLAAVLICALSIALYPLAINLYPVNWFSITKTLYIAPYFFAGQLARLCKLDAVIHAAWRLRQSLIWILGSAIAALYLAFANDVALFGIPFTRRSPEMLMLSLCICAFLLSLRWESRFMAWIGTSSYAIFLFHVIFTAGARELILHIAPHCNVYQLWLLSVLAGLSGPITIAKLLRLAPPILSTLCLGTPFAQPGRQAQAQPLVDDLVTIGSPSGYAARRM